MGSILRNVFIVTPWLMLGSAKVRDSTKDYRGTFMYKQRQCYQDKTHCEDCCMAFYDHFGIRSSDYCSDGTELVFEGLDCNDGSDDGIYHEGTFFYKFNGGSYFCCETIEGTVHEGQCLDMANDCCTPPYFVVPEEEEEEEEEWGSPTEYLYADCNFPYTLRWLYGEAGNCGKYEYAFGKYECVLTTSTSTTTRNSKKDYLGTFMYEGRQCHQDKEYCIDPLNDCCIGSYDNGYGLSTTHYCKGNTEVVFQGADCFDGEDLSTFKEDGGSYFCCEPVEGGHLDRSKCVDGGNDCCAPPPFVGADSEIEYLRAHCKDGYTIQWLYNTAPPDWCDYSVGAFACYSTTTTTTTVSISYEGRICYQDDAHCPTKGFKGCCTVTIFLYKDMRSFVYGGSAVGPCIDGFDPVFIGEDCHNWSEYKRRQASDGGAYYCCESIPNCVEDPTQCKDDNCCSPPQLPSAPKVYNGCNEGYRMEWLTDVDSRDPATSPCGMKDPLHQWNAKYRCCDQSTTTSTTTTSTTAPSGVTTAPSGVTTAPSGHTTAPSGQTTTPSGQTTTPSTAAPSGQTTVPTSGHNTAPSGHTTAPSGHTTAPSGRSTAPSGQSTTRTHTFSPLFRNKIYGWMSCEDIEDTNRSPKRCGVPVNFGNDGPNEHSFVTACDTEEKFDSVVETCKNHCQDHNESTDKHDINHTCDFYSVVKNKYGCTCTLKNTYTLEFATRIHKNTQWNVNTMLWFCDAAKFDDSRYTMEDNRIVDGQGYCVYDLDDYTPESGGTWAIDVKYWHEYDNCISNLNKCRSTDE